MKAKQTCAYLYADGHAVILFEQDVKIGGKTTTVEYAVIHEKWTEASLAFDGRLCFSRYGSAAMMDLAKRATRIKATVPSVENGSENSRKLGVAIGNLSFDFANNSYLSFLDTSIISGQYRYQPDVKETFNAEQQAWGTVKSVTVKRAEKLQVA